MQTRHQKKELSEASLERKFRKNETLDILLSPCSPCAEVASIIAQFGFTTSLIQIYGRYILSKQQGALS